LDTEEAICGIGTGHLWYFTPLSFAGEGRVRRVSSFYQEGVFLPITLDV